MGKKKVCEDWVIGVIMNRHYMNSKSWVYKDKKFHKDGSYKFCKKWKVIPIYKKQIMKKPKKKPKKKKKKTKKKKSNKKEKTKKLKEKIKAVLKKKQVAMIPICKTHLNVVLNAPIDQKLKDQVKTRCELLKKLGKLKDKKK